MALTTSPNSKPLAPRSFAYGVRIGHRVLVLATMMKTMKSSGPVPGATVDGSRGSAVSRAIGRLLSPSASYSRGIPSRMNVAYRILAISLRRALAGVKERAGAEVREGVGRDQHGGK